MPKSLEKAPERVILSAIFHIKHRDEECGYIPDNEFFNSYKELYKQRPKTNSKRYFITRAQIITNIYKYLHRVANDELGNRVYAKSGTIGKTTCKLCNVCEIYPHNFHKAHIISKCNGGSCELSNLYPTCSACNTSMGITDMDIYIKDNKIDLKLL